VIYCNVVYPSSSVFQLYTVSQKVLTFKLSVTLSNLSRFSKLLHCWKAHEMLQETYIVSHHTLIMLLCYITLGSQKSKFV